MRSSTHDKRPTQKRRWESFTITIRGEAEHTCPDVAELVGEVVGAPGSLLCGLRFFPEIQSRFIN